MVYDFLIEAVWRCIKCLTFCYVSWINMCQFLSLIVCSATPTCFTSYCSDKFLVEYEEKKTNKM